MRAAGIEIAWGIEYDPAIAEVARANGMLVTVADILDADPVCFERVDVLHASPPCPNFSTAKTDGGETQHDVALAGGIGAFIEALLPPIFTLENVYAYRRSRSFYHILEVLRRNDYMYAFGHINAADFGVPQTRRRLILRAVRHGLVPLLPSPEPWRGWYDAIADLIDDLPESQLAQWQLERLPETIRTSLIANSGFRDEIVTREHREPAFTVTANTNQTGVRALLISGAGRGDKLCVTRQIKEPAATVVASEEKRPTRALLIGDQSANAGKGVQVREASEPAMTVRAMENGGATPRAISKTRVVAMMPRALARFQSFPDSYRLPEAHGLACRVIGNAVPPLMYQKVISQLVTDR